MPRPGGWLTDAQNAASAARPKAITIMSGSRIWLWAKKPYDVAVINPAHTPARRPNRSWPSSVVKNTAAMAATAMGRCAVVCVTRPLGVERTRIAHG